MAIDKKFSARFAENEVANRLLFEIGQLEYMQDTDGTLPFGESRGALEDLLTISDLASIPEDENDPNLPRAVQEALERLYWEVEPEDLIRIHSEITAAPNSNSSVPEWRETYSDRLSRKSPISKTTLSAPQEITPNEKNLLDRGIITKNDLFVPQEITPAEMYLLNQEVLKIKLKSGAEGTLVDIINSTTEVMTSVTPLIAELAIFHPEAYMMANSVASIMGYPSINDVKGSTRNIVHQPIYPFELGLILAYVESRGDLDAMEELLNLEDPMTTRLVENFERGVFYHESRLERIEAKESHRQGVLNSYLTAAAGEARRQGLRKLSDQLSQLVIQYMPKKVRGGKLSLREYTSLILPIISQLRTPIEEHGEGPIGEHAEDVSVSLYENGGKLEPVEKYFGIHPGVLRAEVSNLRVNGILRKLANIKPKGKRPKERFVATMSTLLRDKKIPSRFHISNATLGRFISLYYESPDRAEDYFGEVTGHTPMTMQAVMSTSELHPASWKSYRAHLRRDS